ncbi:MAG: C2H2-type zinc finger protein [Candidatus Hodarchaeota archaeon]
MSEEPVFLRNLKKFLEDVRENIVIPILEGEKKRTQRPVIPENKIAIFWDYENFPLPNPEKISPTIFLEALFPSGLDQNIETKRVYGKSEIIGSKLKILQEHGFEYRRGIATGKPNETDFFMGPDCASFCATSKFPLVVILISGDSDFLPLIQSILSKGQHDVRLICLDKKKLSPTHYRIVPVILDRQDIINKCQKLKSRLLSLSQMFNYMISNNPKQALTIQEFTQEVTNRFYQEQLMILQGYLELILRLPDFKWQYETSDELIKKAPLFASPNSFPLNSKQFGNMKNTITMKLGYERDPKKWESYWEEFQKLVPNTGEQEKLLKNMYQSCGISFIRSRLQSKLMQLTLENQKPKIPLEILRNLFSDIKCPECKKSFKSNAALSQHRKNVHEKKQDNQWTCNKCSRTFQSHHSLNQHRKSAHSPQKEKPYTCSFCNKAFKSNEGLIQHQTQMHGKKDSQTNDKVSGYRCKCPYCNKEFGNNAARDQHIKANHPSNNFSCSICGKKFATQESKDQHLKDSHKLPSMK